MVKFTQTEDELLKAEKEAEELRAQNSTLTRKGQHQQKEIVRLNKVSPNMLHIKVKMFVPCNNSGIKGALICLFRL